MTIQIKIQERRDRERRETIRLGMRAVMFLFLLLPAALIAYKMDLHRQLFASGGAPQAGSAAADAVEEDLEDGEEDRSEEQRSELHASPRDDREQDSQEQREFEFRRNTSTVGSDKATLAGADDVSESNESQANERTGNPDAGARIEDGAVADIPIHLDLENGRYLHPTDVFGDAVAARFVDLEPPRRVEVEPEAGLLDERHSVRITFATEIPVTLVLSVQKRQRDGAEVRYVAVTPVARGPSGKDESFTFEKLATEIREVRKDSLNAQDALQSAVEEEERREYWIENSDSQPIPVRNAAKERVRYLRDTAIPGLKQELELLKQRLTQLEELQQLADELHEAAVVKLAILDRLPAAK